MTTATTLGGLALVVVGVAAAVTISAPANLASAKTIAAPVLTAKPANPTNVTSASFSFTGPSGATFQCTLDSPTFTVCASPRSYPSVAAGAHNFQVKSISGSGQSSATAYTWTVDITPPPAPTITGKPAVLSNTTSTSFSFADTESGVSYQCKLDTASLFTACSNPQTYGGLAQGGRSLSVKAVDAAGNVSTSAASYSWTVDSIAPPAPVITVKPSDPTVGATHTFWWTESESGVSFQCSTENGAFAACSTPFTYIVDTSNSGTHQFAVRAVDAAGNVSAKASYSYKVAKDNSVSGMQFTISGNVIGDLAPGVWHVVPLKVWNPNAVPIYITQLTIIPPADGTVPGCDSSVNLDLVQATISASHTLMVPAGDGVTLPAQGIDAPQIELKNLAETDQNGCKQKTYTLNYIGTANN